MNEFEKAMRFRHACKLFDANKKIPKESLEWILDMARLSPSSFGLEPWHFLVIENQALKEAIRPTCWDQPQVTTCSHFVILLSRKPKFFAANSAYLDRSFRRRAQDNEVMLEKVKEVFGMFQQGRSEEAIEEWAKRQTYLASANLMNAAASLEIDSCPIEGFIYSDLEALLKEKVASFNPDDYAIAYCIALGYRANAQSQAYRWDLNEITTYL